MSGHLVHEDLPFIEWERPLFLLLQKLGQSWGYWVELCSCSADIFTKNHFFQQPKPVFWTPVVAAFQLLRIMWIWFSKMPSSHLQTKLFRGNGWESKPCQNLCRSEWGRLPGREAMPNYSSALTLNFDHVHICSVRACESNAFPSLSFCPVWSRSFMVGCPSVILIPLVKGGKKNLSWRIISLNVSW